MAEYSLAHVGINAENPDEALKAAKMFETLFGMIVKEGNSSVFAGTGVEVMKTPSKGTHGHIAIGTNSLDRAVYHLSRQGAAFDESTRKPKAIYLKDEVAGFAIHLMQK